MAGIALGLYVVYLLTAFGLRSWTQWRRTGSTGFRGISGRPGSPEWFGGVLFVFALLLGAAAPLLQRTGVLTMFDGAPTRVAGLALAVSGIVATLAAQHAMGNSWRIGVDQAEATALVTGGVFATVRNPVFTAMIVTGIGLTLLAPNVIALVALAALIVAIEIQVRVVEEPYLRRMHGETYADYVRRTGRFVPGLR